MPRARAAVLTVVLALRLASSGGAGAAPTIRATRVPVLLRNGSLSPLLLDCREANPATGRFDGGRLAGCNGPSLVRVPSWLASDFTHLLYYGHHMGFAIRALGSRAGVRGPWEDIGEVLRAPALDAPRAGAQARLKHISSPHVTADHQQRVLRMHFHGEKVRFRLQSGKSCWQGTMEAHSADGLAFSVPAESPRPPPAIGCFYLRTFEHDGMEYAVMKRDNDGISLVRRPLHSPPTERFSEGQLLLPGARHASVVRAPGGQLLVFWTNIGRCGYCDRALGRGVVPNEHTWAPDAPERILAAPIVGTRWPSWRVGAPQTVLEPELELEGGRLQLSRSVSGEAMRPERALRDPDVVLDADASGGARMHLVYAAMGEFGLALAEVEVAVHGHGSARSPVPPHH